MIQNSRRPTFRSWRPSYLSVGLEKIYSSITGRHLGDTRVTAPTRARIYATPAGRCTITMGGDNTDNATATDANWLLAMIYWCELCTLYSISATRMQCSPIGSHYLNLKQCSAALERSKIRFAMGPERSHVASHTRRAERGSTRRAANSCVHQIYAQGTRPVKTLLTHSRLTNSTPSSHLRLEPTSS